ncbi:ATP-dependent DNA helicase [Aeromicrobium sp. CTD01-1L150]|uniref:ATP-dependent DNA helicase n=1 Tax=Aeromicrobium sp. CTD01-1L150 TaxID=3341830 RepID=UPI0035C0A98E
MSDHDVLAAAVIAATANLTAQPRPGQLSLFEDITDALGNSGTHIAGQAPTGTGKSLAYLAPAMSAACRGERTVISTDSLALQDQIVSKDAPVAAEACKSIHGIAPSVAVHKGWHNYACARSAVDSAQDIIQDEIDRLIVDGEPEPAAALARALHQITSSRHLASEHLQAMAALVRQSRSDDADLTAWAIEASAAGHPTSADRSSYDGIATDRQWGQVTVSSAACVGAAKCPLAEFCIPTQARVDVAEADVVVTNHTMLGVQAAKGVPVLFGSATIGDFDHLVIDEAHELPAKVRAQGTSEISGTTMGRLLSSLERVIDAQSPREKAAFAHAGQVAQLLDESLDEAYRSRGKISSFQTQAIIEPDEQGLPGELAETIVRSLTPFVKVLRRIARKTSGTATELKARRLADRVTAFLTNVQTFDDGTPGYARWIDRNRDGHTAAMASPVDVARLLRQECYQAPMMLPAACVDRLAEAGCVDVHGATGHDQSCLAPEPGDEGDVPRPAIEVGTGRVLAATELNVCAVSATMPATLPAEAGLDASVVSYPSPFDTAYAASAFWVPQAASEADQDALRRPKASRTALDTSRHPEWAAERVVDVVQANGGSALILASTSAAGRLYADVLRSRLGRQLTVLSQWDGASKQHLTARWKAEATSVLVGTRSYMTGIDAPGPTCSLVVVDRIPRNPASPVDEARRRLLRDRLGSAAPDIYAVDAALLLEQAVGRLIRSEDDSGLVAVLDPRLHKKPANSAFRYPRGSRELYVAPLKNRFGHAFSQWEDVRGWLAGRDRLRRPTAA